MELYVATGLSGAGWLAALLTYSLHAALWAAVVPLFARWRSVSLALTHTAWKVALLAPLMTTCFAASAHAGVARRLADTAVVPRIALLSLGEAPRPPGLASGASAGAALRSAAVSSRSFDVVGAALLLAAALGVARFGALAFADWRRLRGRRPVRNARLRQRLQLLASRLALAEVKLTESAEIDSPLVLGNREICVPLTTLVALDDAEVDAVFAHELAHLERGDGLWFPALGLVRAGLWFHPLTRFIDQRLRHSAELACDERCLELTGQPLALARALTRIAERTFHVERVVAVPTMTQPRRGVVARVARLTSHGLRVRSGSNWQSRAALAVGFSVLALLCLGMRARGAEARLAQAVVAPPAVELNAQLDELSRRAERLETELAGLATRSVQPAQGTSAEVRRLEVEQELSHVRQMQAFLETPAAGR